MSHHPDILFDDFSTQIMKCHIDAIKTGVYAPQLRSLMTDKAKRVFFNAFTFRHVHSPPTAYLSDDFEFRGSKVTVIPGEDVFFHTRCTNLPEQP